MISLKLFLSSIWLLSRHCRASDEPPPITKEEVHAAQKAWGDGLVKIGIQYKQGGDYVEYASKFVDSMYAYDIGPCLFKPTVAGEFRLTRVAAISYFVGGNAEYPEDLGWALTPWAEVRWENAGVILEDQSAIAMGTYYFIEASGKETMVQYSIGYLRDANQKLRIHLQHSSVPYIPSGSTTHDVSEAAYTDYHKRKNCSFDLNSPAITNEEVHAAQKAWADGVINIGIHYKQGDSPYSHVDYAAKFIDSMYAYDIGTTLFKPTLAGDFRLKRDAAISYMVGGHKDFPDDHGFALKPWVAVRWENAGIILEGQAATAMGNYFFTDLTGQETKVQYTFGYMKDASQKLRINLHHSSIPFVTVTKRDAGPQMYYAGSNKWGEKITKEEVHAAQKAWADGVISIGNHHKKGKQYADYAAKFVDSMYAYDMGTVLFKPTMVQDFRLTRDAAISYMIGGNPAYPQDGGFALKGWVAVRWQNAGIFLQNQSAIAMGNYYFKDSTGKVTTVEYSFGYIRDASQKLRINLHHSSIPFLDNNVARNSTLHTSVAKKRNTVPTENGNWQQCSSDLTPPITKQEVYAAQKAWADGVINLGSYKKQEDRHFDLASTFVDNKYAYDISTVLFKPTMAGDFRLTHDSAISYMVGRNPAYPEDHGFALKPWVSVRWENAGVILRRKSATAMGNYWFTDPSGKETKVEYSFGYIRDSSQKLRINLHHSSIPYAPTYTTAQDSAEKSTTAVEDSAGDSSVKVDVATNSKKGDQDAHEWNQQVSLMLTTLLVAVAGVGVILLVVGGPEEKKAAKEAKVEAATCMTPRGEFSRWYPVSEPDAGDFWSLIGGCLGIKDKKRQPELQYDDERFTHSRSGPVVPPLDLNRKKVGSGRMDDAMMGG